MDDINMNEETPSTPLDNAGAGPSGTSRVPLNESAESRDQESDRMCEDDLDRLQVASNQHSSFSTSRSLKPVYDDDSDDDTELYFGALSGERKRTFSECDSPTYPLPECRIYDSDAESANKKKKALEKFLDAVRLFAASQNVGRRTKPKPLLRTVKSDGEMARFSYCNDTGNILSPLSGLHLKRSLSNPPTSSAEVSQRQKKRLYEHFQWILKSCSKPKETDRGGCKSPTRFKTNPSHEKRGTCFSIETDTIESKSTKTAISKQTSSESFSKDQTFESFSGTSGLDEHDLEDPRELCSAERKQNTVLEREFETENPKTSSRKMLLEKLKRTSKNSLTDEAGSKSTCLGTSIDSTSKSSAKIILVSETRSSSENSEVCNITTGGIPPEIPMSPPFESYSESPLESYSICSSSMSSSDISMTPSSSDESKKSPPKISSEPRPSGSGVLRIPTKMPEFKTPELPISPGTSKKGSNSSGSPRRPKDLNEHSSSELIPDISLMKVSDDDESSSCSSDPTSQSTQPTEDVCCIVPKRKESENEIYRASVKKIRSSATPQGANVPPQGANIIHEPLSESTVFLQPPSHPKVGENASPKRIEERGGTLERLEGVRRPWNQREEREKVPCTSVKMQASVIAQGTSGRENIKQEPLLESTDFLQPPSFSKAGENVSPKRKVEDLDYSSRTYRPDNQSPESASKKTKGGTPISPLADVEEGSS